MDGEQMSSEERAVALEQQLATARAELDQERLARQIESELQRAGATETEATAALLRERVRDARAAGKEVDVRTLVMEMKKSKAALFGGAERTNVSPPGGATGVPRVPRAGVQAAQQAAEEARESGDRRALLRYLRLRRG